MVNPKRSPAFFTNLRFSSKIKLGLEEAMTELVHNKNKTHLDSTGRISAAFAIRTVLFVSLFGLLVVANLLPGSTGLFWASAYAAENSDTGSKYGTARTKKRHAVGQQCGKKLEQIQVELEGERWSQARSLLKASLDSACKSSYEKSQVWNFLAYTHYSMDNFQEAINSYKKVIAEPETDERLKTSVYYSIAQLYFAVEDYKNAARFLETWMKESAIVGADGKVLLAQAYYQLNRKTEALKFVNEAIDEWQKKGNTPKENWWGLQRVLYYEKKDYRRVVGVLKKLIKHYPKYSYWRQLGGMYGELDQEINQLITNEVLYLAGVELKEKELLGLAYLFIGADSPYLAAKVVEKGIKDSVIPVTSKNMEFLGHAWQQAQEGDKARSALEQAAKLSDQGKIWARLAGVYLDIGDDKKAVRASRNALNKGGLKRNDLTYMVLGNAQLNLNCYNDAIKAFEKASQDKRSSKFADKWIEYSRREGARREKLIEMGANIAGCARA